jgi:hypothetical protein
MHKEEKMKQIEMLKIIDEMIKRKGAQIISFKYFKKTFGNMVLEINYKNIKHVFVVDRREIYHNGKFLFEFEQEGNNYYQATKESPNLHFLLKTIDETLL